MGNSEINGDRHHLSIAIRPKVHPHWSCGAEIGACHHLFSAGDNLGYGAAIGGLVGGALGSPAGPWGVVAGGAAGTVVGNAFEDFNTSTSGIDLPDGPVGDQCSAGGDWCE
jgi:hypothetical protein